MVVETTVRTRICLIDPEDASRVFRHLAPVTTATCVDVCRVPMSRDDAWRILRDENYRLQSDAHTIFVVTECHDELGKEKARHIAESVFKVPYTPVVVMRPTGSPARLATAAGR